MKNKMKKEFLKKTDPKIYQLIQKEFQRQKNGLEMIASENFTSSAVLEAMANVLTNKYAEGYPGKRYYSGNQFIDKIEETAIKRCKKLFSAEHANVQPHSGTQANMAAYLSILKPGDKVLAMDLASGGHLSHGAKFNFSGKFYRFIYYGVNKKTEKIDLDEVEKIAKKAKPKLIIAGGSSYPRKIDFRGFAKIARKVRAYFMADIAHIAGLVAAKIHPSPVPYADIVTSTTQKTLRGPRGGFILCKIKDRFKKIYHPKDKKNLAQKIDSAVFPGCQGGPLEHIIAAKAVAFKEALSQRFVNYQKQTIKNAKVLAETLKQGGLKLISQGTDTHLILIDLTPLGLSSKKVESALEDVGIYVNKNVIPFDKRKPTDPSGIRIGTPALTTRGMKEKEMKVIGLLILAIIYGLNKKSVKEKVKKTVKELSRAFPLPNE